MKIGYPNEETTIATAPRLHATPYEQMSKKNTNRILR